MTLPERPARSTGNLPAGYREVLHWRLTESAARVIQAQLLGAVAFVGFGLLFAALAVGLGRVPGSLSFGLREAGWVVVGLVVVLTLHELTHGLVMRWYGARPIYGVLWTALAVYATAPGFAFPRRAFVRFALAPLVVLSAVVVLGVWLMQGTPWVALLAICGVINAAGAIGDLWMTAIVLRYAPSAYVMDERDGIRVFEPGPSEAA